MNTISTSKGWQCGMYMRLLVIGQCYWLSLYYSITVFLYQLGAGTAIPGLVAAKCGAHVTLTDREDNPILLEYLRQTCGLNGVEGNVSIVGLTWGVFSPVLLNLGPQDIILASDCFYDSKGNEDVCKHVLDVYYFKKI